MGWQPFKKNNDNYTVSYYVYHLLLSDVNVKYYLNKKLVTKLFLSKKFSYNGFKKSGHEHLNLVLIKF